MNPVNAVVQQTFLKNRASLALQKTQGKHMTATSRRRDSRSCYITQQALTSSVVVRAEAEGPRAEDDLLHDDGEGVDVAFLGAAALQRYVIQQLRRRPQQL